LYYVVLERDIIDFGSLGGFRQSLINWHVSCLTSKTPCLVRHSWLCLLY